MRIIIIIILSVITMVLSNPSLEQFNKYYEKQVSYELDQDNKDENLLGKLANNINKLSDDIFSEVEHKNYHLVSIYKVNYGGKKQTYLGIFKIFLKISDKD